MGRHLVSTLVPVVVLPLLLSACEADQPLKAKQGESDLATSAVSASAPSASDGWLLRDYGWESAHPYQAKTHQVFTFTEPGAGSMRLHFSSFDLENGYDWVTLSTPDGSSRITYTGKLGDFWSSAIPGPSVVVTFDSDASVQRSGFVIAGYAARPDGEQWITKSFVWETPHPYADNDARIVEISEPGALKMRVLFGEVDLEAGYDFVRVYDAVGRQVAEYTGTLGKFETPAFPGDHLWVSFTSDESVTAGGVSIAQYSAVMPAGEPGCTQSSENAPVCGENGKTYPNASAASCESVAVKHAGACGTQGDFCGGMANTTCAAGWSCRLDGSWPDAGGSCVQ